VQEASLAGTRVAGPDEICSVAAGLGFRGHADLWRGPAVLPGANPVPQSEGEEPPICAVIKVGLAALSGTDPAADP
jgi:hypothetical protein